MRQRLRSHLTYANVMATLAVFLVLSGGTAVALNGSNTVQSDDLGPGAQVKAPDVADNAVNSADVVNESLTSADIRNGQVKRLDQAQNQATDWALIDLSERQIIARSPGVTLTDGGQSFAWVNFHHSVAGRPIVATDQFPTTGDVRAVLCGSSPSEEDITCDHGNDHNHVYVDLDPDTANDTVYLAVLPK
jgi:hypothetical protein